MEREIRRTRRSMLGAAGSGVAALLLAGCTGPEGDEDADLPAEEETGNGQDIDEDDGDDGGGENESEE